MSFEFIQPFDGTQPEVSNAEREHVSLVFSSFVDSMLLSHIDKLLIADIGPPSNPNPFTNLKLKTPDRATSISITSSPNSASTLKAILVQKQEGVYGKDALAYQLGTDGLVRRQDLPEKTREQKQIEHAARVRMPEGGTSPQEGLRIATSSLDFMQQAIETAKLEQDMGMNNQPIGIVELESLIQLVESAEVK